MMLGNSVPLPPPLHRGVVAMAQGTREGADAAALSDDALGCGHVRNVRHSHTYVNDVDKVRRKSDTGRMSDQKTGEILQELKRRAGMSLDAIARAAGYAGRSSVQVFFSPSYEKLLDSEVAQKLAGALAGKGVPPIQRNELLALTGVLESNGIPVRFEGASSAKPAHDLPVYGTSLGAPKDFNGVAIEQTMLNTGTVIEYIRRPPVLHGQTYVYGLYVQGSSMWPRYDHGETIIVTDSQYARPPKIGDDVVVYMRDLEEDDGHRSSGVLVKRLVRRTAEYVELEQFNPQMTFKIAAGAVLRIDRVVPFSELLI